MSADETCQVASEARTYEELSDSERVRAILKEAGVREDLIKYFQLVIGCCRV